MNLTHWLLRIQFSWLLAAAGTVLGFRMALLTWRPAMILVAVAIGGLVFFGFFSLVLLFTLLRKGQHGAGKPCLLAAGISMPALIGVLLLGLQGTKVPLINDISTDTVNPPLFEKVRQLRQPGDNSADYPGDRVAIQQSQAYPDIGPITVAAAPAVAFEKCRMAAEQLGWRIVAQHPQRGLIEALDQSLIFGFTDDIVIRIAPAGSGSRIDIRSASRAGVGDLGVNAKRIRAFAALFNTPQAP